MKKASDADIVYDFVEGMLKLGKDRNRSIILFNLDVSYRNCKFKSLTKRSFPDEISDALSFTSLYKEYGFWLLAEIELDVYALVRLYTPEQSAGGIVATMQKLLEQGVALVFSDVAPAPGVMWGALGLHTPSRVRAGRGKH